MVTYGIVLALMFTFLAIYPLPVKLLIAGGTFISTAIVPGLFIFLLVKNGAAGDLTVKVEAKPGTGETGCGPTGSFLQHDFARAARWLLRLVRRWLARYELARSIVVKE